MDNALNERETNTLSIRVLQSKNKLTYSDINNIFIVSIQARHTWSAVNLHFVSKAIWKAYKDKLEFNHLIILREILKQLYIKFLETLVELNTTWIENHKLLSIYETNFQSIILKPHLRKTFIEKYKDEYKLLMTKEN